MFRPALPLLLAAPLLAGPLASCTVGPDYDAPVPQVSDAWIEPATTGAIQPAWWDRFDDPQLSALIARAMADAPSLAEARARLAEARANRDAVLGARAPQVSASGAATENRISENGLLPVGAFPGFDPRYSLFDLGFDASWEIDLWGRRTREAQAAQAQAEAAQAAYQDALVQLTAEIARGYMDLRAAQQVSALAAGREDAPSLQEACEMLDERGEILEWFGATSDVTERRLGEERLREARDALALATSASQLGWGAWDFGADEAGWDARGREIIGLREDETTIRSWMERVHPEDREALEREIEACVREARPFDLEYRVVHRDGTVRVVHGTGMFERRPASGGAQGTGLVRDVTELRRWEEAQRLLVGELNHRVKNMLAIVQSTARQTQRTTSSVEAFNEAFEQRIHAIAGAHGILTRRNWSGAELGELAREALASFSGDGDAQVRIEGPEVDLRPDATISFAMALHELATNALKHGALSRPEGRVDVRWRLEAGDRVFFEWVESGGPEVTPPARRGFGSRLLERGIAVELDGDVPLEFLRDGLHCTMEFLIDGVVGSDGAAPPGGGG